MTDDCDINEYVMRVLTWPRDNREAAFSSVRVNAYMKAIMAGQQHSEASMFGMTMESRTRARVQEIEASGATFPGAG